MNNIISNFSQKIENPNKEYYSRPPRIISHALVEVKKYKYLPFKCYSGVLLDISLAGFKLEFTSEVKAKPSNKYWLKIPLSPLGIWAPKYLIIQVECRWFDEKRYRMGGVFICINKQQRLIIEQIIDSLTQQH